MTALFIDGPRALETQEVAEFAPVLCCAVWSKKFWPVEYPPSLDFPFVTKVDYFLVGIGIERKVGIYSTVWGDKSLLKLAVDKDVEQTA